MAKARGKGGGGGAQTAQPPEAALPPPPAAPVAPAAGTARSQASSPRQTNRPGSSAQSPALAALARGDVKTARRLAAQDLASGNEANREIARRIFEETRPDPAALIAAAAVLIVILLAAWLALFRSH